MTPLRSTCIFATAAVSLLVGPFAPAVAQTADAEPSPFIQLGDCQLAYDPLHEAGRESLAAKLCLRGRGGTEINFVSGTPEENAWMKYGELQGGLFITRWLSVQGRGYIRALEPLDEPADPRDEGTTPFFDRSRRYGVVQIGSPALDRIRLTAGLADLPFGIDRSEAVQFYRMRESRGFWSSPPQAAWITADNQVNYQLDVGISTDVIEHQEGNVNAQGDDATAEGDEEGDEEQGRRAFSARLMVDFSALDGSRVVVSGYGEESGGRRFGLGFVTVNRSEDMTQFEFVRSMNGADGGGVQFAQLLRLGYLGAWRNETRLLVQIDDERRRSRTGTFGFDALFYEHVILRLSVSHIKSESGDGIRRWFVTSGLEVTL